mgnify:CR=1 FL=1
MYVHLNMSRRKPKKSSYNPSQSTSNKPKKKGGKREGRKLSKTKRENLSTHDGMENAIIGLFNKNPSKLMTYKEVSKQIRVGSKLDQGRVQSILEQLTNQDKLEELGRGRFQLNIKSEAIEGNVDSTRRGGAYIITTERDQDIYVHSRNMNQAMHGDTVKIKIIYRRGKEEGIITKIIKRITIFSVLLFTNDPLPTISPISFNEI